MCIYSFSNGYWSTEDGKLIKTNLAFEWHAAHNIVYYHNNALCSLTPIMNGAGLTFKNVRQGSLDSFFRP